MSSNMKKAAIIFLSIILLLSFVSCFESNRDTTVGGTTSGNPSSGSNDTSNVNTTVDDNNPTSTDDTNSDQPTGDKNILVAYFSATGNTAPLAEYVSKHLGADLYEIKSKVPYTEDDLKYYTNCRADREQNDPSCRPEIDGTVNNIDKYNVIFIAYPIWHGQAPKIIYTFLESYDLTGKTIIPFCTSASSGIGSSADNLHASAPGSDWRPGRRFAIGTDEKTICSWVDEFELITERQTDKVKVTCNGRSLEIIPADNLSAKAFIDKLKEGDITVKMNDYGDFEKVGELGFTLPQTNTQITTSPGDVILYLGSNITIYYGVNSWNFTLLGKIPDMTRETMLEFFGGSGEVTVTFSLD